MPVKNSGHKRKQILASAEQIMTKRPYESTISEIAGIAGVTDSVIYHYFKSKEDLLFSIMGEHMKEVNLKLNEQLEGILDPTGRLSKLIWFHLTYNFTHREYSHLLLFQCRSNRDFYRHEAFDLIRQYSGVLTSILKDGVELGVFRDVNMQLVSDIIFGFLDLETIRYLCLPESQPTSLDLRQVMAHISAIIEFRQPQFALESDKSVRILGSAEKVFAEKGYGKATIGDIARMASVAEGTVYGYFKNKEDLLLSIPKVRLQEYLEQLEGVFEIKSPLRKLRRFIRYHFFLFWTELDFLKVFILNIHLNSGFYSSEAYTLFQKYLSVADEILEEGKREGSIRSEVNNTIFKNLFWGGFTHIILRWIFLDQPEKIDKTNEINEMVSLLLSAVSSERS